MNNQGIDDILIDANNKPEKKGGSGFLVFAFLLIIIAGGLFFTKYYLENQNNNISAKDAFVQELSKTNAKSFMDNELYEKVYSRMQEENYEIDNNMVFTSSFDYSDNEYLKDLDFSKFNINLNTQKDNEANKSLSELLLQYSGNDIFNLKVITTEKNIAFYSEELNDKFIAIDYDDINKTFETSLNLDNFINNNKISLSKSQMLDYFKKYRDLFFEDLTEDKFSINENYIIKNDNGEIEVTAYVLNLNQNELNQTLIKLLENLKKDDDLINGIITGKDSSTIIDLSTKERPIIENLTISNGDEQQEEQPEETNENEYSEFIKSILLGNKINISYNNFIEKINETIEFLNSYEGQGIKISIYSSENRVEKISVVFPNSSNMDIELPEKDSTSKKENELKITYIKNENKDGFSIDYNKKENSAKIENEILYSFIEESKINKKLNININTEGTTAAKTISNDIVISYLTNDGEFKSTIENKIKFLVDVSIQNLNDENCLFLSRLNEEEYTNDIENIYNNAINLYNSKRENLKFIDLNTTPEAIEILTSTPRITAEEAWKVVFDTVANMMGEAIAEEREFTIENLEGLTIDGYDVSVDLNENEAIVTVDSYKFKIDRDFNMSVAE